MTNRLTPQAMTNSIKNPKAGTGFERPPLSLTARVMVFVALAIGASLFMVGHLVQNAVERHFAELDAGELVVVRESVERALRNSGGDPELLLEGLSHAVSGHHGVYFQVWDLEGRLVYGSPDNDLLIPLNGLEPVSSIQAGNLLTWVAEGKTYRGALTETRAGVQDYRIVTAIDMDAHIYFLTNLRRSLWIIMTLASLVTLLAAWYGVHRGHAPLRGLSDTLRDIQADSLYVRLNPASVPRELQDLVASSNLMLGRLEESFLRLTHFSADIAHELRTPLTNIITQTQVGLSKVRSAEEYRELLYSNLEEQERLAKMVNDMLWLAKSDHGLLKPEIEWLDLASEVRVMLDFFEALAEEKHIELCIEGSVPKVLGDRSMLRRAVSNLLSNAVRYTNPGEQVQIQLATTANNEVTLSVRNPGQEISAEQLTKLFDRFYRADPARVRHVEGAGLGLAIVKSIIDAHGGRIQVFSDNGITQFTLFLPLRIT